ncbi:MAG: formate/nitrite transporter family protein [Clostridia bacterium]|nr:formate/nitrite transporter family protein [Clostridia bacterium]
MLKKTLSGVCAGVMIAIGGSVYLACENRYIGAVLFSVALLTICFKGYSLYTGRIGFIPEKHDRDTVAALLLGLVGNLAATIVCGFLIRLSVPALGLAAESLCAGKLVQNGLQTLIRGVFCGVLMYVAVSVYRDGKNITGILFGIPVFILSGFEHSIADMFYFAAGGMLSGRVFLFILTVILGNSLGAVLLPLLSGLGGKEKA